MYRIDYDQQFSNVIYIAYSHTAHPDTAIPSLRFAHLHRLDITEQINAQNPPLSVFAHLHSLDITEQINAQNPPH